MCVTEASFKYEDMGCELIVCVKNISLITITCTEKGRRMQDSRLLSGDFSLKVECQVGCWARCIVHQTILISSCKIEGLGKAKAVHMCLPDSTSIPRDSRECWKEEAKSAVRKTLSDLLRTLTIVRIRSRLLKYTIIILGSYRYP